MSFLLWQVNLKPPKIQPRKIPHFLLLPDDCEQDNSHYYLSTLQIDVVDYTVYIDQGAGWDFYIDQALSLDGNLDQSLAKNVNR